MVKVDWRGSRSSAEGARIEAPKAPRGVGYGEGVFPSSMGERSGEGAHGEGAVPPPRKFFNFLFRYAAFWVQSDAFSNITRLVPNSLHSQPAESSDMVQPACAKLDKGCRAF